MNRIEKTFTDKQNDILSVYYPAGYPKLDDTMGILQELENGGVDMVELGIPFSDPMADGVVIQDAATIALKNGMTLRLLFQQIENMRQSVSIPVILMGYLNPIMQYGFEKFCADCKRVGIDGVIIPDLPFNEYIDQYKDVAERYDIKVVMFITPETSQERIHLIDNNASGFIYMVSSASTTGVQATFEGAKTQYFERINGMGLKNPRMIGFGISNIATYNAACNNSRGGIVGSYFVKLLSEQKDVKSAVKCLVTTLRG